MDSKCDRWAASVLCVARWSRKRTSCAPGMPAISPGRQTTCTVGHSPKSSPCPPQPSLPALSSLPATHALIALQALPSLPAPAITSSDSPPSRLAHPPAMTHSPPTTCHSRPGITSERPMPVNLLVLVHHAHIYRLAGVRHLALVRQIPPRQVLALRVILEQHKPHVVPLGPPQLHSRSAATTTPVARLTTSISRTVNRVSRLRRSLVRRNSRSFKSAFQPRQPLGVARHRIPSRPPVGRHSTSDYTRHHNQRILPASPAFGHFELRPPFRRVIPGRSSQTPGRTLGSQRPWRSWQACRIGLS